MNIGQIKMNSYKMLTYRQYKDYWLFNISNSLFNIKTMNNGLKTRILVDIRTLSCHFLLPTF